MGSGHFALTLRHDYREQLRQAHEDLGIKRIRSFGMLDDDVLSYAGPTTGHEKGSLDFSNITSTIDFLDAMGMAPAFSLTWMPEFLRTSSRNQSEPQSRQPWP